MSENTTVAGAVPTGSHPPGQAVVDPKRWLALVVVSIAQLMVVVDGTIVNIAMPSAQQALHIDDANRQWIVTAYSLAFGGLLLLGGRIADYVGRKRIFIIGLIGFGLASALGGAAQNEAMLFAARALQGAFGALLAPAALSIITVTFTDVKDRAKAFGVFGAVAGVGAAIGLLLGGVLTQYANWRWTLFVNIFIAAITVVLAVPIVRESRAHGNTKYDIPGTLLSSIGIVALVYGFTEAAKQNSWTTTSVLVSFSIAAVLLIAFVILESRIANPLLPLRVVWHRNRGGSFLTSIILGAGMLGMFLFMTFYLQGTLGWSAMKSGVAYMPFSGGIIAAAIVSSRLLPRTGPKVLMTVGGVLATAAMVWLTRLDLDSSYTVAILPSFIAMSFGMGLVFVPMSSLALSGIANHDAGVASAMVNTTQQVGGSLGTALLNTIFTTAFAGYLTDHGGGGPAEQARAAIHGYNVAFTASAVLLGIGAILVIAFIRKPAADPAAAQEDEMQQPVLVH
jgi:EmrB/QacA subfamily drug resistance transporter